MRLTSDQIAFEGDHAWMVISSLDDLPSRHAFDVEIDCPNRSCSNSAPIHHCMTCGGWPSPGYVKRRVSVVEGMVLPIVKRYAVDHDSDAKFVSLDVFGAAWLNDFALPTHETPTMLRSFPSAAVPGMFAVKLRVAP